MLAGVDITAMEAEAGLAVKLVCKDVSLKKQKGVSGGCSYITATLVNEGDTTVPAYSYILVVQSDNQQSVATAGTLAIAGTGSDFDGSAGRLVAVRERGKKPRCV